MTEIATKLSFAESRAHVQAQKNNSDLSNLAHALDYIEANRIELKRVYELALEKLTELELEISSTADAIEGNTVQSYGTVHSLYEKARNGINLNRIAVSL